MDIFDTLSIFAGVVFSAIALFIWFDVKEDVKNSKSFDQAINRLNYRLAFFVAFFIATTWFMGVLITAKSNQNESKFEAKQLQLLQQISDKLSEKSI